MIVRKDKKNYVAHCDRCGIEHGAFTTKRMAKASALEEGWLDEKYRLICPDCRLVEHTKNALKDMVIKTADAVKDTFSFHPFTRTSGVNFNKVSCKECMYYSPCESSPSGGCIILKSRVSEDYICGCWRMKA